MEAFFVGRQPILNKVGETIAYELLFRSGETNAYDPSVDGDSATSQVLINAISELGIDNIAGKNQVFINLTNRFIEHPDLLDFLPRERVVLEVLETVTVNPTVLDGLTILKERGYTVALDDFVLSEEFLPFLPFADIIKYDITQYETDELLALPAQKHNPEVKLLAERVETAEEFDTLKAAGFDYFQGYYFAKPNIVQGRKIPGDKITQLQLMAKLNDPSVTVTEISEIMSRDVSLGVRALKFVNSPISGLPNKVNSIHQAVVMLGRDTIKNWITLLMMAGVEGKPAEVVKMALVRARFCQLTAQRENLEDHSSYFTAGLLSLLDAMMDQDIQSVLDVISATDELRQILLHRVGRASELIDVLRYLEDPSSVDEDYSTLISDSMPATYLESISWAEETTLSLAA